MRDEIVECAREAEDAVRRLARMTIGRPDLDPADIDVVIAHLADAVAALPQAVTQLGDMLENTHDGFDLTMDAMTATDDPAEAIDVARLHLDAVREPAVEIYRRLDAAHQWMAHIVADDRIDDDADLAAPALRRPEHRQPPTLGDIDRPPGRSR